MISTHRRTAAIALAAAGARPDGTVPSAVIRCLAADAGVNERTVRRWVNEHDTSPTASESDDDGPARRVLPAGCRSRWTPTRAQLAVIAGSANLAAAHRDLSASDPDLPSYPTFRRAVAGLDAGVAAAITRRGGAAALISHRMYLTVNVAHRNDRWVMDSQEIPVRVLAPHETMPRKYWQTTALDEATRMVMGTVLTAGRPTSQDVASCIAIGIRGFTTADGTFVGGLPTQIVWDNAGEFLADQITEMALTLAFTGTAVTPYAPYEKGKIECWHRTIQTELFAGLPGCSHGPRTFSGKEMWVPAQRSLLTEDLLIAHTLLWVEQYNCTRPHGGIGGQTPLERWQADPVGLRFVPDEALYDAMLVAKRTHKVGKNGIRFRNRDYVAAELNPHVGRSVQLRYLPHDDSFIEVFSDDKHVATATAVTRLTPEQRRELLNVRRVQYVQARGLLADGARLRIRRHEDTLAAAAAGTGTNNLSPLSASPLTDARDADAGAYLELLRDDNSSAHPSGRAKPATPADDDARAPDQAALLALLDGGRAGPARSPEDGSRRPAVSRALPGLETAAVVPTMAFNLAHSVLDRAHAFHDIAVLSGPAGCGKTFALEQWLAEFGAAGGRHTYLEMPPAPAAKEVSVRLLRALNGSCDERLTGYTLTDEIVAALNGSDRLIVIDEAHNLGKQGVQRLRYLHQRGEFSWTLVLVGSSAAEVLFGAPEMRTRAEGLALFLPLDGAELLAALKKWHPLLERSANDQLRFVDEQWARGNFRLWAKFLRIALTLAPKLKTDKLTDPVIAATLAAVGADAWRSARAS